ncbi:MULTISPECIES: Tum protein [Pectobacterium]|uniref:Tum protein n=1 Tax=Pectobacterium TaxID=122277 RepID=UPI000AEA0651|nr:MULTISPECIES: Tum protein [Pectobacterium]MBQ4761528.1 Tum protein [Pectobacterium versatile]
MLERVELIARLANESCCKERDKEIALGLIADLVHGTIPYVHHDGTLFASDG